MDLSSNQSSRTASIIESIEKSIKAAIEDSVTSAISIKYDIGMWLMLLLLSAVAGLTVLLFGVIIVIISGILSFVLFPVSNLVDTLANYFLIILLALGPLSIGFVSTAVLYPDSDEEQFVPNLPNINYPILMMGPILIASIARSEFLFHPGNWSGFVELVLGFLILTSIVYRSTLYGLVHAIKTTNKNNDSRFEALVVIYPGFIGFVGFSWISWAIQYRLALPLSDDLSQAVWELPQLVPGVTLTQSHIAEVPVVLAVSIFALSAVSMVRYKWNGIIQTGNDLYNGTLKSLYQIFSTVAATIAMIVLIIKSILLKLLSILQYITLTSGK